MDHTLIRIGRETRISDIKPDKPMTKGNELLSTDRGISMLEGEINRLKEEAAAIRREDGIYKDVRSELMRDRVSRGDLHKVLNELKGEREKDIDYMIDTYRHSQEMIRERIRVKYPDEQ